MLREQRLETYKEMYVEEGANLDIRRKFKDERKEIVSELKTARGLLKKKNFQEARNHTKSAIKLVDKLESDINEIDSTLGSTIFSWLLTGEFPFILRNLVTSLIPFGPLVNGIDKLIKRVKVLDEDYKSGKLSTDPVDSLNLYKNAIKVRINELKTGLDKFMECINTAEKKSKEKESK